MNIFFLLASITAIISSLLLFRASNQNRKENEEQATVYKHFDEIIKTSSKKVKNEIEQLEKRNKELMIKKGVNIDKVRFIFTPSITYEFTKDIVNPKPNILFPMKENGLFDTKKNPIYLKNRSPVKQVIVDTYENVDWNTLKKEINNSIKGFVFFITNESDDYHFEIDTERVRYKNLDTV